MDFLAIATGAVGLTGTVSISLFFIVGGVFGTLNDVCNAVVAILTAALAWRLLPWQRTQAPQQSRVALGAAWAGALGAVAGSMLVIFRITGWYLAGLVTTFGYAFIGVWLASVSQAARRSLAWPRRLAQFGQVTGAIMAVGFLAAPGILAGVDDQAAAPWWVSLSLLGGLGWALLFPVWCLWLGRGRKSNEGARPRVAEV